MIDVVECCVWNIHIYSTHVNIEVKSKITRKKHNWDWEGSLDGVEVLDQWSTAVLIRILDFREDNNLVPRAVQHCSHNTAHGLLAIFKGMIKRVVHITIAYMDDKGVCDIEGAEIGWEREVLVEATGKNCESCRVKVVVGETVV